MSPEEPWTRIGTVAVCARYPVKSLCGQECDRLELTELGVRADRGWALRTADGRRGSGKNSHRWIKLDHLLEMSAWRDDGGTTRLRLPDGREYDAGDPAASAALSEVVGQPVTLVPAGETPHYDLAPIHLVTSATLRWWADQAPGAAVGWQRTRANLVLSVDGVGRPEDDWVGRRLRLGSALLEVAQRCERCVMVTQAQGELSHGPGLLRVLAPCGRNLGVYATVLRAGVVELGDEVLLGSPGG